MTLTDDELAILDWLFTVGEWEPESFAAARHLGKTDADRTRLRAAATGLLRKEIIEIRVTRDFEESAPRLLTRVEAEAVLSDEGAWALPGEPLFDPNSEYYLLHPKLVGAREEAERAIPAYAAALQERALEPGSIRGLVVDPPRPTAAPSLRSRASLACQQG